MNPSTLQTLSQIIIAVGVALTALGGFGSYYYGKIKETRKDEQAQEEIDDAKRERKEIYDLLEPFTEIANQKFPDETDSTALSKLASELSNLKKKTKELEKRITPPKLSSVNKIKLIKNLTKYSKINVILRRENSPSLIPFIDDLVEVFEKSGWNIIKNEVMIIDSIDGVIIYGKGEVGKPLSLFTNELYQGLMKADIKISNLNADQNLDSNTVGITVGTYKN